MSTSPQTPRRNPSIPSARAILSGFALLLASASPLSAEQFGLFTYEVTDGETVTITDYPEDATGEVVIPAEIAGLPVTAIGYRAFRDCSGLSSVTIPDSVATMGFYAFWNCSGLTSVTIPDSVTSIGGYAFRNCRGLTSVTIGNSVTSIGYNAFAGCSGLTSVSIPDSVTWIGTGAFMGCTGLLTVTIPAAVSSIGTEAFLGCASLEVFEVDPSNPHFSSADGVLFNAAQDRLIRCPQGKEGRYVIPSTVTEIASKELRGGQYWSIIGEGAFLGCDQLTEVIIPEGVLKIGIETFSGCAGLVTMTLPESITSIGGYAFQDCAGLTEISLGASVTNFEWYYGWPVFSGCTNLAAIHVDPENPQLSSVDGVLYGPFGGLGRVLLRYPAAKPDDSFLIPASTIIVHDEAFSGSRNLTSVSLPDPPSVIFGETPFLQIGRRAFSGCTGLTSVFLPASVYFSETAPARNQDRTSANPDSSFAFSGCPNLTAIHVAQDHPDYSSIDGVLFNKERDTLIQFPHGRGGHYAIPDSVTAIESTVYYIDMGHPTLLWTDSHGAFDGCTRLTSVRIPQGVSHIGLETFRGCRALTTVTLPSGIRSFPSEVEVAEGSGAFADCPNLESVLFLGDAPLGVTRDTFANAAPNFAIHYLSCSEDFTSPTWNGYPTVRLDGQACPAGGWLVHHGLPHDADLNQDLNGDGVTLLMAHALRLDPRINLSGKMPQPELSQEYLSLSFHGGARGIRYIVETSTDLRTWTTDGVEILLWWGRSRAEVRRGGQSRYLRLRVELE